jgi:phage-related protein
MDTSFRPSDETLSQLVSARREEVVRLQRAQADALKDTEARGKSRLTALKKSMPQNIVTALDKLNATHDEAAKATGSRVEQLTEDLSTMTVSPEFETAVHPGLAGGHLVAPSSVGWFTPYYGTLHGSNGAVYWQGYNPGNIDLSDSASGAGSGLFGSGAGSFTVYMDWWFSYLAPQNRFYGHTIYVPFHGFYIVIADDGFWDSKEAHARIDLSAVGYQYNYKSTGNTNEIDVGGQNLNVNDRLDGWRTMYYADLLGMDRAYLRVTASFYVYARGGGSTAQLDFSSGNANYMGVPWVYID